MNLHEVMNKIEYPASQLFDPETLKPLNKTTAERMDYLYSNYSNILQGESFIDIGCSKGYLPLAFSNRFDKTYGVEPHVESHNLSEAIRKKKGFDNVKFYNDDLRSFDTFPKKTPVKYDVVFVGNVHHYFFSNEIKYKSKPFLFMRKLAAMADKYLIIDGPFNMKDPAVITLSKEFNWSDRTKDLYSLENFCNPIMDCFKVKSVQLNQHKVRQTVVFERVKPSFRSVSINSITRGSLLDHNKNRPEGSVFVSANGNRCKIDIGHPNENMWYVLNYLPEYINPIERVVIDENSSVIGDESKYLTSDGEFTSREFGLNWLEMCASLNSVGVIEPSLTLRDTIKNGNRLINIDTDMCCHYKNFNFSQEWATRNMSNKILTQEEVVYIRDRYKNINCFSNLLKKEGHK